MTISVCTLAHGREDHLVNLIRGLEGQHRLPEELIIGVMQRERYSLPKASFPIRQLMLATSTMCLAAARNAAASAAVGKTLVFLDVDCIPTPTLVATYAELLAAHDFLLMGEVLYLPPDATENGIDLAHFAHVAVKHSDRAAAPVETLGDCDDYRCFWSLNFAMRHGSFDATGGFDERYVGYGGEDTDFGHVAMTAGLGLRWCRGARAYHQYHDHYMPPVHHVDSVIANATLFRDKWGHFTMDPWLKAFTLMGLVKQVDGEYVRVRNVDDVDRALTRIRPGEAYASSSRVLEALERGAPAIAAA